MEQAVRVANYYAQLFQIGHIVRVPRIPAHVREPAAPQALQLVPPRFGEDAGKYGGRLAPRHITVRADGAVP